MSHQLLRREIETRLKAQLDNAYPNDVVIRWENVDFDKDEQKIIVAPVMMPGRTFPSTVGRTHIRSVGLVQFDVMTVKDTGTGMRDEVAAFIGNFFAAKEYTLPDGSYACLDEADQKALGLINGRDRLAVSLTYEIDIRINS
jgi:hypothetical protein